MKNLYKIKGEEVHIVLRRRRGPDMLTIVDKTDLSALLKLNVRWYANYNRGNRAYYAACKTENKVLQLHRYILEAPKGKGVDHFDHDTLNNRRSNLRLATVQQNAQNRQRSRNNSSGIDGVYWNKKVNKWHVRIQVEGKRKHLGYFTEKEEARKIVDAARAKYMPYSQQAANKGA